MSLTFLLEDFDYCSDKIDIVELIFVSIPGLPLIIPLSIDDLIEVEYQM